jgi:hypothetical protein
MPLHIDPTRARAHLEERLYKIGRLRGTGPNPFEYGLWDARTVEVLEALYGPESPEMLSYFDAAGIRGRLPGVRGQAEDMTLNIHGQWGIRARLDRGEVVLKGLLAAIPAPAPQPSA